jgi:hypothetical protein
VLDLKTGNGRNAAQFGDGCGPRHAPSWKVGEAGIENLAGPGEVIEALHDLFERRDAIGYVRPVEVDPIGLERLRLASTDETIDLRLLPVTRMPAFGSV